MTKENCYQEAGGHTGKPAADSRPRLSVSIVIPARDEASSIGSVIPKVGESLAGYSHEIIVVDDGSVDETSEIAQRSGAVVVIHRQNLGKGAAMKTGVEKAKGDLIVFMDGDGAHDPRDIPGLITPILERKADFVIGSRCLPESRIPVSPVTRRLTNKLASFTISIVISFLLPLAIRLNRLFKPSTQQAPRTRPTRITDCTSGFRAITKDGWQRLELISQGFQIETEMIYEAVRNRLTITEAPIGCDWDSRLSHLSIFQDGFRTLKLLARKLINDVRRPRNANSLGRNTAQARVSPSDSNTPKW